MGVKMIWPHDRSGLSLISPDLNQNKAARRKRATKRKETLTPWAVFGYIVEPIRTQEPDRCCNDWAPMERSVGGRTPVVAPGVTKSLSTGFNGSQNSSTDQNLWTIGKRKTFVIQIGPLGARPWGLHLVKLLRGNNLSHTMTDTPAFRTTQLSFGKWIISFIWPYGKVNNHGGKIILSHYLVSFLERFSTTNNIKK